VPATVDRKRTTEGERVFAGKVLDHWNDATGQRLSSPDWLAKIIMRMREHPEVVLTDHMRLIDAALADPWWRGDPSPSVVYGNGAIFERCLSRGQAAAPAERAYDIAERAIEQARRTA
jgi:hypothetical protein